VWVTKRVLSPRPERPWLWVDGDDQRLNWARIHAFFSSVQRAGEDGAADGFFKVSSATEARAAMAAGAPGGSPANCPATAAAGK
jgi:hypothetical protein